MEVVKTLLILSQTEVRGEFPVLQRLLATLGISILSPLDLEEKLGLVGGDIMHGVMSLDQMWAARPVFNYGDYKTPVKNLFICGSGAHPGGGVTGLPGKNSSREILKT